jgi:transposase
MDVPIARTLSSNAQQALRQRVIQAIEHLGLSVSAATWAFGVHRATVGRWWNRYRRHGAGAFGRPSAGAEPRSLLDPNQ